MKLNFTFILNKIIHYWTYLLGSIILIVTLLPLGSRALALADTGYKDFLYTGATAPTGQKPQSKLWHNDGIWWGVMFNKTSGKFEIHRLDWTTQTWSTTGTMVDSRSKSSADALWDGSNLYTVSAVPPGTSGDVGIKVMRFSYNTLTQAYSVNSGFPVVLANVAVETVVMDKDSTGALWATYTDSNSSGGRHALVTHSTTNDLTWSTPYVIPTTGANNLTSDDISTLVAYNGKIGVMWSNTNEHSVYFASHMDGTADNLWALNPALQGPDYADDHINIKSLQADSSGQVYAAVKTGLNDVNPSTSSEPLILLLELDNNGSWSRRTVARVSDNHTRPIVLLDAENREVYVFMTYQYGTQTSGAIYYKKASLDNKGLQFPQGLGMPFIEFSTDTHINNISSTKQALNGTTNLVAIAGDDNSRYYFHNMIDLPNSGPTATPTNTSLPTNTPLPATNTSVPPTATPMGAPLFADGFESSNFNNWTTVVNNVDGFASVQSGTIYSGGFAAKFTSLATNNSRTYIRKSLGTSQTEITASGYFMITQKGANNANIPIFRLFNPSGTRVVSLYRQNSSGLVRISDQSTTLNTSGTMPLNTWIKFELHVIAAGTGLSTLQIYMNNLQILNTSAANVGTAGILNVQLGSDTNAQLYTLFTDDIVVAGSSAVLPTLTTTSIPPTATSTSILPTATPLEPTATPLFTNTPEPPTATSLSTNTPTETSVPTATPLVTNLFADGFESGDFSAWTSVTTGGDGTAIVQGAAVNSGAFAAQLSETANTGSLAYIRASLSPSQINLTISIDIMITQEGVSGGNVPILRLFDSTGTRLISLYRQNLSGNRIWVNHSGASSSTTGLLPLSTWSHFDIHVITAGTNASTIEIYENGTLIYQTTTASLGISGILSAQVGNETARQVFTLYADNVQISR